MALISNLSGGRRHKAHRNKNLVAPAKAEHVYYVGGAVSFDASGLVVPGVQDGAIRAAGILVSQKFPYDPRNITSQLDTRGSTDGSMSGDECTNCVEFDTTGRYHFLNVLGSPVVGGWAYLVDDDTVSADPTLEGIVLGEFAQSKDGGWFVDIGKRNLGLGIATDTPVDFVPPVLADLAPDSPAVQRSDVLQYSLTNRGDLQAGAASGTPLFAGVAAEDAQPGDRFRVWRGGRYPVRIQDGEALPVSTLLTWENTGLRFVQATDFSVVGITLEEALGGVGEIRMCEIYWPPNIRVA